MKNKYWIGVIISFCLTNICNAQLSIDSVISKTYVLINGICSKEILLDRNSSFHISKLTALNDSVTVISFRLFCAEEIGEAEELSPSDSLTPQMKENIYSDKFNSCMFFDFILLGPDGKIFSAIIPEMKVIFIDDVKTKK